MRQSDDAALALSALTAAVGRFRKGGDDQRGLGAPRHRRPNKAMDADAALQELGSELIGEAYVTATVMVWDEDALVADGKLRSRG